MRCREKRGTMILRTTQTETLCITEEVAAEMIAGWLRAGASVRCVNGVSASYVGGYE